MSSTDRDQLSESSLNARHTWGSTLFITTRLPKGSVREAVGLRYITWAFVLTQLLGALIGWLATRLLDTLFADEPDDSGIDMATFAGLLSQTIREALQEVLQQHDIELLIRSFRAMADSFSDFLRTGGVHRLQAADVEVNNLIQGFRGHGDRTAELLAAAACFKILILQEYTKAELNDETKNIEFWKKQFISELGSIAQNRHNEIVWAYEHAPRWQRTSDHGEILEYGYVLRGVPHEVGNCLIKPMDKACLDAADDKIEKRKAGRRKLEIENRYDPLMKCVEQLKNTPSSPPEIP